MAGGNDDKDDETPTHFAQNSFGNIRTKSLQRDQMIAHLKSLRENINEMQKMSAYQLEVKLSLLERQFESFEKVQMDLELLDESQITLDHKMVVEETYFEVKSAILERLALYRVNVGDTTFSSTHVPSQPSPSSQHPHLPTLQLSKFDGTPKNWLEFYNMFCSLVHDKPELSPKSKFQYLKSCLTGNAARLIQSLEVTADNYEHALDLLKNRFDNKKQLFQSHLLEIFEIQKVNKPSVFSLQLFIDNVNASMRALESIASKQQIANGIILQLVVSKLDTDSQIKWEDELSLSQDQSLSSTTLKIPSWNELASFLERRCKTLEIFENSRPSGSKDHQQTRSAPQHYNRSSKTSTTSFVTSNQQGQCIICNSTQGHSAFRCSKFIDMNVLDRFNIAKRLKLCLNCLGTNHIATSCPSLNRCQKCNATHHTLLHRELPTTTTTASKITPSTTTLITENSSQSLSITEPNKLNSTVTLHTAEDQNLVILATAIVDICSLSGTTIIARALLDSGSQSNFITERMVQHLHLPRKKINLNIGGIGDTNAVCAKYSCSVTAKSHTTGFAPTFDAVILAAISSCHPQRPINISGWNIPANIKLADNKFNIPGPIDLLMGADLFWDLLMVGRIKLENQPNFIKTKLGWIVSGSADTINNEPSSISPQPTTFKNSPQQPNATQSAVFMTDNKPNKQNKTTDKATTPINSKYNKLTSSSNEPLLENLLESFWKQENYEEIKKAIFSPEEAACEKFFKETTKRCPYTNKFIVRLPFKVLPPDLGESRQIAQRRFTQLEARLYRDTFIQKEYKEFINVNFSLQHMAPTAASDARYLIPHHCVIKPESSTTRLRVVFDASCATTNGKSLNDMLQVGPTLQDDVFTILSRFRYHKFVLVADIAKMYRQVLIDEEDMKWQCILWKPSSNEPWQTYKLRTVTYGTSCAPYLAVRCLRQLAQDEANNYPIGAKITLRDFYVDNLMTGGDTEDKVIEIKRQVTSLLQSGGFPLRKFASNSETILADVPQSEREAIVEVDDMQYVKTLGLKWSPTEDVFSFSYPHQQKSLSITKRSILSHMASFFDPLGFINPLIVRCKILMQDLWKLKLHWDESVPHDVFLEWKHIRDELNLIGQIKIPRYVDFNTHTNIHIFADASKKAYGACIYAVTSTEHKIDSYLLCAKSRVAPTKEVSLPRLELCAALLGGQLLQSVKTWFPTTPQHIFCWSDSTITLSWIAGEPSRWPTFVANRVTKIQHLTADCIWRHVPSELNPADLLSRGTTAAGLDKAFWFKGPDFLIDDKCKWPKEHYPHFDPPIVEIQSTLAAVQSEDIVSTHKYANDYEKLLRVFAYVKRFIMVCRKQIIQYGTIDYDELNTSLELVCQIIQQSTFHDDLQRLSKNKPLNPRSKLIQLSPFLHNGLIRVGGRLKNSSLPFSTKHPILLPNNHSYVSTIIRYFHIKNLHAGALTLHNILRDQFWIINGRNKIKQVIHRCVLCYRCRPTTESQVMGSLPTHRVEQSFPFTITGIDYCGPFFITSKIRGRGPSKVYLAIFICFSVKAVHLELVPDLTSAAFISALKRFIARRGHCAIIYTDNATNFIGANRELKELLQTFLSDSHNESVRQMCRQEGIIWKFIPPRSPHFGGLWESAVKQAKHYIRRTVGNLLLTYDELHTVCCQTEAIINSRPLTPLSADPHDLRPLTPAHFLVGRPLTALPEPSVLSINPASLKRYQMVQWIQQQFWDRWRNEYLKSLQLKTKWETARSNIQVNDLVLLKEDNIPPLKWPLARVIECSPGEDGMVRVVTVKTAGSAFKRAITKLCKLPIDNNFESTAFKVAENVGAVI